MSSTPSKQIDGDVAISRNVHIGGKTTIRGSVTVGHNLKIEGWLDAANIKGPNKGLFKTAAQLREAYPTPHEGWWALVGNTLPAQVYIADGGSWTASKNAEGNPILAGNPTIDSSECVEAIEALEDMAAELDTVKANVGQNTEDIHDLRSSHTTQGNHINLLQKAVETAQARADKGVADAANAQTTATNAQAAAKAISDAKGVAGGFAPLDSDGKIPEEHLPMPDVVEFKAAVESVTVQDSPTNTHSSAPGTHIVYDKSTKRLLLAIRTLSNVTKDSIGNDHLSEDEGGIQPPGEVSFKYYSDWADKDSFGIPSANGVVPSKGKIYISTSDNKTWRWSGSELVIIGSDLALGFTNDTAFPGNEGAQLRNELDSLATAVAAKAENEDLLLVEQKNASIAILPFDGVFDPPTDGSVIQFPAGGVWWQPQEGNFLFCSSDFGYTAADYNADGAARTDRIFRHDNILYRYDGSSLVGAGITDEQAEQIRLSAPIEVASEEEMEQLIADGECQAGQIYFLAEEE